MTGWMEGVQGGWVGARPTTVLRWKETSGGHTLPPHLTPPGNPPPAGVPFASASNLVPFVTHGAHGIFAAASIVFFTFVGFDVIACAAEETRDPSTDLPVAIMGCLAIAAILYAALALTLCAMVPTPLIDGGAPFPAAFLQHITAASSRVQRGFLIASSRIVSFGALLGIVAALLVTALGQARIYVVLGRERLLPPWIAGVSRRGTPARATWITGVTSAVLAMLVDLDELSSLVSIGTLFVFFSVSAGVLKRRHTPPGGGWAAAIALIVLTVISFLLSSAITYDAHLGLLGAAAAAWAACVAAMWWWLPNAYTPAGFKVWLSPFTPALSMFANIHLIGSLGVNAYIRFVVLLVVAVAFYALYGVHSADRGGGRTTVAADAGGGGRDAAALELALAEGDGVSREPLRMSRLSTDPVDEGGPASPSERAPVLDGAAYAGGLTPVQPLAVERRARGGM